MRRAFVFDILYLLVMLLVLAITVVLAATILGSIEANPQFNDTMTEHNATYIMAGGNTAIGAFDNLLVAFFILMNLTAIASALLIRTHPVFFILNMLLMAVLVMVSAVFSNIYYEFASNSVIAPFANNYPLIYALFTYLPGITLVFSVLLAVVMYGKTGSSPQYNY